ncbi:MAG: hypothetical protein ACPG4U_02260 [Pseudomonadales bacterium]
MKAFVEIHLKLIVTIWLILFSVLGLLLLMNYMKFSSMMSGVVSSQLQVISSSMQRSIIKAEQLGLPLAEMQNLPQILQREQQRDPQIKRIVILDSSANALFDSRPQASDTQLPEQIMRLANRSAEVQWSLESEHLLYSGLQLFDATEQLMGNIVIVYDKSGYTTVTQRVLYHLLGASALIFAVFAALVFLAVRLGFSDINNIIKLIGNQLSTDHSSQKNVLKPDSLAYQFARQMEQREQMKRHVSEQLAACCPEQQGRSNKP